jgi:hypothetical protein
MAQAIATLRHTLVRAEHALAALEREPGRDTAFAVSVLGLGFQITYAQEESKQAEQFAQERSPSVRRARTNARRLRHSRYNKGGDNEMNGEGQNIVVGSLAGLFREQSMEEWLHRLLDERTCMDCKKPLDDEEVPEAVQLLDTIPGCMDCKKPLDDEEGTMEFCGQIPHVELIGHLCAPCGTWREVLRQGRHVQREET